MMDALYVDDERTPPIGWQHAKSSAEAIEILKAFDIALMSLDHDLGEDDDAKAIIYWLIEHEDRWPKDIEVHSQNPVGRQWLTQMILRYKP